MGLLASVIGVVLVRGGGLVARLQQLVRAQAAPRRLTESERARLERVFGEGLALDAIRVVAGRSGVFGLNDRPFTLGPTVYLKHVDPVARFDVVVHECVHVWQYQHLGARYSAEALLAQVRHGWRGRGAYDWQAEIARGRDRWVDFNLEAQGSFVQDLWRQGDGARFEHEPLGPFVVDGTDHRAVAVAALAVLRGPRSG